MRGVATGVLRFKRFSCTIAVVSRGGKFSVCRYETGFAGLTASFALAGMCGRFHNKKALPLR